MATVEDLICLKHSIYKELKACLEPEDKAKTVLQKLEAKCTEHSDIIYSQQTLVFRLKKASKREYLELQNLENAGLFKSMLHSHKVKVEEQREKHRKAFQAEKEAVVHLENVQAEKENLSKQILVAQQEYQRYKGQHLQLNQFITDIFKEANNAENYPELSALTEKIGQENQAKSRCQTENYQAEKKKREISSAIQSLGKACKALTLGINASTLLDTLSSKGDHKHSLNAAKHHVEFAVHLLKAQGATEAYMLKGLLDSMVLRNENYFFDDQRERNEKRRVQLKLWEAQIQGTQKGMQINLLAPLNKKINDVQREIRNHDHIIMTLKNDILEKQQQILDNILSDIPDYQPTGAPPPYIREPTTSAA